MSDDAFFDTCFLIDLERERRRGRRAAHQFLASNPATRLWISWTVAAEFAEGFPSIRNPLCSALLNDFEILEMDEATADHYARISVDLRQRRLQIGVNDMWIAAAALAAGIPLVTNNVSHFGRVAGLTVVSY